MLAEPGLEAALARVARDVPRGPRAVQGAAVLSAQPEAHADARGDGYPLGTVYFYPAGILYGSKISLHTRTSKKY